MRVPRQDIPVDALKSLLSDLREFVVIRNEDIYANFARGGDADLLVSDLAAAEQALLQHLGMPQVIQRRSYVVGYYYEWGYIDLFPRIEWHGAVYLPNQVVFDQAKTSKIGQPKSGPAHEALVCWFSSLLWGGFLKERYRDLIVEAARDHSIEFRQACTFAAGTTWGERLVRAAEVGRPEASVAWTKPLRRVIWRSLLELT